MTKKIEVKPTGSLSDKGFALLEGATGFIKLAMKLEAGLKASSRYRKTILVTKQDAESMAKMLRHSAIMIDNLLSVIEARELPKIDKFGHRIPQVARSAAQPKVDPPSTD